MPSAAVQSAAGPAWMSWLGVASILLGILFASYEANEWMRQVVVENATPASLELPTADCREDELEEEGLTFAECEQMVEEIRSYIVSKPGWFAGTQSWLAAIGTILSLVSVICGAMLANYRMAAASFGFAVFALLVLIDAGHFVAAQQAGPILRAIHLPVALQWFAIHLAVATAFYVASCQQPSVAPVSPAPVIYGRFEIVSHWFVAASVFFLFVSSWWMLSLPLPSDEFRYREFPFQLHKNLGLTVVLLMIVTALIRITQRRAESVSEAVTPQMRRLRLGGHVALYVLVFAVCVTGYMSSSYSGWGTTFWWLIELPYWGYEDEELNQLYSDLHLWTCWALLLAMAAHIGAALLHALRNDGTLRRMLRW